MKMTRWVFFLLLFGSWSVFAGQDESHWNTVLKQQYYGAKTVQEGGAIFALELPYRAEDPALVPLKIISKIDQTKARYIKKITLFVDENPFPFAGEFEFTPLSGKADLAMRLRINTYSYVRAVAQMNNGELYMVKQFVKASGGCSAPLGADLDAAMQRLGKMKFKLGKGVKTGKPSPVQLLISHPNITGMQMDQVTRFIKKSRFVDELKITFDGAPVLTAKIDIAISADPNFRFYFIPTKAGVLKAQFTDVSCATPTSRSQCSKGRSYSLSYVLAP